MLVVKDPVTGDTLETARLTSCDVCGESMVDDAPKEARTFFHDTVEHLDVCENCLQMYQAEAPP